MSDSVLGRCLVTGASGPLGSAVTRLLVMRGHRVAALVRSAGPLHRLDAVRHQIEIIEGSLDTPERAAVQIGRFAPHTVFHLAWQGSGRDARNHSSQIDVNVTGSLRWLSIFLDSGAQCWVGLGSQAEYGPCGGHLHEDQIPAPANAYGLAKLCVGQLSLERCKIANVRAVWLRLLATYGPADAEGRLIPYLIRSLLSGESPQLSAGTQRWDYLYIDDAAEAVVASACSSYSGVLNLASGSAWTVAQLASFLRDHIDPSIELKFGADMPKGLEADISRLVQATGWMPRTSLENGLRQTADWYRSQREEQQISVGAARKESVPC